VFTACVIKHRRCCLQAASSVLYNTSCKHSLVLLRMGEIIAWNMLSWLQLSIKFVIAASNWLFVLLFSLFLCALRISGGCCSHAVVPFYIHYLTYAEHSLTILFPQTTIHIALFFVRKHYQQRATAPTTDSETLWPWTFVMWGNLLCEKNYLSDWIQCCHFHCFIPYESYITDFQQPAILLWKPCIETLKQRTHQKF